jgi:hypothetical protein
MYLSDDTQFKVSEDMYKCTRESKQGDINIHDVLMSGSYQYGRHIILYFFGSK